MASLINLQSIVDSIQSTISSISSLVSSKADKTYVDSEILTKADAASTLNGYGINDAYTKTEVTSLVDTRISNLLGTASANLDTLGEIGAQLANDENAVSVLTNIVSQKADTSYVNNELSGKESSITAGTNSQYWRGDKNWRSFATDVLNTVLTGISVVTSSAVISTDTLLVGIGKLQAQINSLSETISTFASDISDAIVAERSAAVSLSNKTLVAPTIQNYTEYTHTANITGSYTVDLSNGTLQKLTLTANTTITLPDSLNGKSYTLLIGYNGTFIPTFTGGSTLKWSNQAAPPAKSTAGFYDIFVFTCDGTNTYGRSGGSNF